MEAEAVLEEVVGEEVAAGGITDAEAVELEDAIEEVATEAIAEDLEGAAELEETLVEEEVRSDG
jgi:hypothetical protein